MFAFQSPYGERDTVEAFAQVLNGMFTTDDGIRMIQSIERDDEIPILSGLYVRVYDWGSLDLFAGNRAQRFWSAYIRFEENSDGTYGEVIMDRPKGKVYKQYEQFAALNINLPGWLSRQASFKIVKRDMI